MTTTTKKATKTVKTADKGSGKKSKRPAIPPSAGVTVVDGREFVIMPLADFEEWQDERLFAALVRERIESDEPVVPFEEIAAKLNKGGKGG